MSERSTGLTTWLAELRRRKVGRVAVAYAIAAWLAIQVAGETFEPLGLPAWSIRLVIVLAGVGFPLALALAWAFDIGPRGVERTPPVPGTGAANSEEATTAPPGREPAAKPQPPAPPRSVAILPFVDMSPERDQDYFCDGIAEEIINALCCVRELKIASRTSAFQFKGRAGDVRVIGRTLGVSSVLEGSVRKAGDQLRITAQLVSAEDGYHLWSETFDRRLEDVFAIQSEIAQHVMRALRLSLTSREAGQIERPVTTHSDAYEFYLRGRAILRRSGAVAKMHSRQMFERSIAIDPNFALAYAGLATGLADDVFWKGTKDRAVVEDAWKALRRAEELQPGLPEVLVARAWLLSAQGQRDEATAEFDRAIERAPGLADAYYWYGRHCVTLGDHAKAVRLYERMVELDPSNYTAWGHLAMCAEVTGDHALSRAANERAVAIVERHLELDPDDARAMQFGAAVNAMLGRRERALELITSALALQPDSQGMRYNIACAYARLGEADKAIDLLEQWVARGARGASGIAWIREDADLGSLREHPRFRELLARLENDSGDPAPPRDPADPA